MAMNKFRHSESLSLHCSFPCFVKNSSVLFHVYFQLKILFLTENKKTSSYATWFTAGGAIHSSLWCHWWCHNSETI